MRQLGQRNKATLGQATLQAFDRLRNPLCGKPPERDFWPLHDHDQAVLPRPDRCRDRRDDGLCWQPSPGLMVLSCMVASHFQQDSMILLIMPRFSGVSSTSTVMNFLRPSRERNLETQCDRSGFSPRLPLTVFFVAHSFPVPDFRHGLTTLGSNVARGVHLGQAVQGGANDVVRVGRTVALWPTRSSHP